MKIQDCTTKLDWMAFKAEKEAKKKINSLIEKASDKNIYLLARQIGRCKIKGEPYGDLEKQLKNELTDVKLACDALNGYEKKLSATWSESRELKMSDRFFKQRVIKNKIK